MPEERVKIFDTTLRDGEQSPGCSMDTAEKKRMAKQLEELGVDILEAGFPVSSEGDFDAVRQVASQAGPSVTVAGLARAAPGHRSGQHHRRPGGPGRDGGKCFVQGGEQGGLFYRVSAVCDGGGSFF